jgi:hypothetical protein
MERGAVRMRRWIFLLALAALAAAPGALALETVRGVVRETSEFQCATGCGSYSLDPDPTFQFTMLQGNFQLYVDQHVQITGYRDDCSGCFVLVAVEPVVVLPPLTSAGEGADPLPAGVRLRQNYPNPFNPSTVIEYDLPAESRVRLSVHNLLGEEVGMLADELQPAGVHRREWAAGALPGGAYYCRLRTSAGGESSVLTRMMLLLR